MEVIFSALFLHNNNCCVRLNTDTGFLLQKYVPRNEKRRCFWRNAGGWLHAFPIFSHMNEICELWQNVQNTTHLFKRQICNVNYSLRNDNLWQIQIFLNYHSNSMWKLKKYSMLSNGQGSKLCISYVHNWLIFMVYLWKQNV